MKRLLRKIARGILQFYPEEYGKYTILQKVFFPLLAPRTDDFEHITMRDGIKLRLNPRELLQAHLYLFGTYELPTTRFMRRFLKQGNVALDVGANIGYISLLFSQCVGEHGTVLSLEPEQANFRALSEHIRMNNASNIVALQEAASTQAGTMKLYLFDDNYGAHSLVTGGGGQHFTEVATDTLDNIVQRHGLSTIHLIKIDIEGAELEALQGMSQILKTHRPVLILEMNEEAQQQRNSSTQVLKDILHEHGYTPFSLTNKGFLTPYTPKPFENTVFIPSEQSAELRNFMA
jgi:FkbM family methyltransferase